jgi:hypothetical protein
MNIQGDRFAGVARAREIQVEPGDLAADDLVARHRGDALALRAVGRQHRQQYIARARPLQGELGAHIGTGSRVAQITHLNGLRPQRAQARIDLYPALRAARSTPSLSRYSAAFTTIQYR